jgi:hypothetical protein
MKIKNIFSSQISKDQAKDTGMAIVLILLLIGVIQKDLLTIKIAIVALIFTMATPLIFKYVTPVWLSLSYLLGTIISKLLLAFIFYLIVFPVGFVRRLLGYDTLKLNKFKKGTESVMQVRNKTFTKNDIDKPF